VRKILDTTIVRRNRKYLDKIARIGRLPLFADGYLMVD
jgi:hypothetical protein